MKGWGGKGAGRINEHPTSGDTVSGVLGFEFSVSVGDELLVAVSAGYFVAYRIDSSGPFVMFQASE